MFFQKKQSFYLKLVYSFLLKKWYSDRLVNELLSTGILVFAKNYSYIHLDRGLLEIFGPSEILHNIKTSLNFSS